MLGRTTHRALTHLTTTLYMPLPVVVVVTRARRTRRRRAGTPRARGTRPAAAVFVRATPGTCGTRRAAPRTPRGLARRRPRPASREKRDAFTRLIFWTLRPHCDVLLHACCRKTVKELLRGLLAALGGQGEAVWQRQLSCIDGGSHQHLRTAVMTTVAPPFGAQPHR